jgi:hypothetical protein
MDTTPIPKVETVEKVEKVDGRRRKATDKQLEGLRKGMAILKEKREALAKEKEERIKTNEELKSKGLPPIEPPLKLKKKDLVEMKAQAVVLEPVVIKERKPRSDKGKPRAENPSTAEFKQMKEAFLSIQASVQKPAEIKEVIREVKVPAQERVVEKVVEKVLSGNALLDKIFFNR